jgi:hypothetical protein
LTRVSDHPQEAAMEIVDVTLTPVQRRAGAALVPWRDLAAQQRRRGEPLRELAPGDDVMLRVDDTVQRGWVLRSATVGTEVAYVIMFGATLARRIPLGTERRPDRIARDRKSRGVPAQRRDGVSLRP